jgi:hypothetical protein
MQRFRLSGGVISNGYLIDQACFKKIIDGKCKEGYIIEHAML